MAQWVNDPVLSLLWLGFDLWPGNLCMPQVRAKNKHTLIINKKKKVKKNKSLMILALTFPVPPVSVQMYSWPHEDILLSASCLDTCMFYICYAVEAKIKMKT